LLPDLIRKLAYVKKKTVTSAKPFGAFAIEFHASASLLKSPEKTKKSTVERDCDYLVPDHFHPPFRKKPNTSCII
jgi:hypothetical protein